MNRRYVELSLAFGAGLLAGGVGGFLFARRQNQQKTDERFAQEIESLRAYYAAKANMAGKGRNPNDRAAALGDTAEAGYMGPGGTGSSGRMGPGGATGSVPQPEPNEPGNAGRIHLPSDISGSLHVFSAEHGDPGEESSVGESADDGSGKEDHEGGEDEDGVDPSLWAESQRSRRPEPEVISAEEFRNDEEDFRKVFVTWYEADKVLVDDREIPVRDFARIVGKDFASQFGQKSDDDNIVYIRNRRIHSDFEVTRHHGSYSEVVLGYGKPQ